MNQLYAMAPKPEGAAPGAAGGLGPFIPIILIFVIFYFLLIRPQQIKQKKHREMLQNLERGDEVVTNGGVHGTIVRIKEDVITLKVAEKVEIQVSKSAIAYRKTQKR
jgi:preprotein translocase subunit YajC